MTATARRVAEGGIVAPMIAAGPGVAARGAKTSAFATVMDLAPSFLELFVSESRLL